MHFFRQHRCVPFDHEFPSKWISQSISYEIPIQGGKNMFSLKGAMNDIGNKGTSIHSFTGNEKKLPASHCPTLFKKFE